MRAFTEEEKKAIREKLLEEGKEAFIKYGLKKVSLEDLTQTVNVAKSSFYLFFKSKEELFLEILEIESEKVRNKVIDKSFGSIKSPKLAIKSYLTESILEMEENPIFRMLLSQEFFQLLYRKITPEYIERMKRLTIEPLLPFIETFQKEGSLIDSQPEVIGGALRAFFFLPLHKEEIGKESFDLIINLLIEVISSGMLKMKGGV